jgi:hypothetical protein
MIFEIVLRAETFLSVNREQDHRKRRREKDKVDYGKLSGNKLLF